MTAVSAVPPQNTTLHALLQKQGVEGTGDVYDLDGWQLHTHPDLCDRLQSLNPHCYRGAYGVPVLATDRDVYFGVAMGTSTLALRLPPEEAAAAGGREFPTAGAGWVSVDPWKTDLDLLKRWCRAAQILATTIKE